MKTLLHIIKGFLLACLTWAIIIWCVAALANLPANGATTNQIVIREITWQFDADVTYGQFVNGDYWVVAPVTITNMLPAWTGTYHGWEINPNCTEDAQGYTTAVSVYSAAKRPDMPLTISTNASLVKTEGGSTSSDSWIHSAEVLTILEEAPPNGGTNHFRPPYIGTNKPLYQVSDLQTNLLPSLSSASVTDIPTLASVEEKFSRCLRLDHNPNRARQLRPNDAMSDYMPKNTEDLNNAMLRLMLDDPLEDKMPALILFSQHALDRAYAIYNGYRDAGTGHNPNQRIVAAFGAVIFNITDIITYMSTAASFHEDDFLWDGPNAGRALWGQSNSEKRYWEYVGGQGGNRANRDPYGYVDGGTMASYLLITAQSIKGTALVANLFTNTQSCFPADRLATVISFAERWVTNGIWALPDPAAPFDGVWANYGITFGPDGSGGFYTNGGRFPTKHGGSKDGGQYRSAFVASMWDVHSTFGDSTPPEPPAAYPELSTISPENRRWRQGQWTLSINGTNFNGATNVTLSGPSTELSTTNIVVTGNTNISATFSSGLDVGNYDVDVWTTNGLDVGEIIHTVAPPPSGFVSP